MAIKEIWIWEEYAFDRHVIPPRPGRSHDLSRLYRLDYFITCSPDLGDEYSLMDWRDATEAERQSKYPDIKEAGFSLKLNPAAGAEALGVGIHPETGAINIFEEWGQTSASQYLHNFLVKCELLSQSDKIHTQWIRIHVHEDIRRIWISPGALTVRAGEEPMLSVLCEFSDMVVGEISDWAIGDADLPRRLLWRPDARIDEVGVVRPIDPMDFAKVSAQVPGTGKEADPSASASIFGWQPWTPLTVSVKLISGPGFNRRNEADVWNILFVSEGFVLWLDAKGKPVEDESPYFDSLVRDLVRHLRNDWRLWPLNFLARSDRLNVWTAFTASSEKGISVNSEVAHLTLEDSDGLRRVTPIDLNVMEARQSSADIEPEPWSFNVMITEIGLPVVVDRGFRFQEKLGHWQAIYGPHIQESCFYRVNPDMPDEKPDAPELFLKWLRLADRTLVDAVDSAFAFEMGSRLSQACGDPFTFTAMSAKRMPEDTFANLLASLRYPGPGGGVEIGSLWSGNAKSAGLVCFVCRSERTGGTTSKGEYFSSTVGGDTEHTVRLTMDGRLKSAPPELFLSTEKLVQIVAHELGHAFGLGDEYAGGCAPAPLPDSVESNLQLGADFGKLVVNWSHWHRIAKAAILNEDFRVKITVPDDLNKTYSIKIRKGQWIQVHSKLRVRFKPRDILRLRLRPMTSDPAPSAPFVISKVIKARAGETSDTLEVQPYDKDEWNRLGPGDYAYPKDSLVFVPVRDRDNNELFLVHPGIMDHLRSPGGPINAPDFEPWRDCRLAFEQSPEKFLKNINEPTNLPDSFLNSRTPPVHREIVGLYEGGAGRPCGVFRASGVCLMSNPRGIVPFCPVCRYLLVDAIDPTLYAFMEAAYAKKYPKPV